MAEPTEKQREELPAINELAFATWNFGQRPDLPNSPSGSGCNMHYCWFPTEKSYDYCGYHGGRSLPLPNSDNVAPSARMDDA